MKTRPAHPDDAPAIQAIYGPYVETSTCTFEFEVPALDEIRSRMAAYPKHPWLVVEDETQVVGYAYACPFENREGYRFTVETSIYLRQGFLGRGIGTLLYGELLAKLKSLGYVVAVARIALPNPASQGLHEQLRYHKVAHFERIGNKLGRWIDVGYWQREL